MFGNNMLLANDKLSMQDWLKKVSTTYPMGVLQRVLKTYLYSEQ